VLYANYPQSVFRHIAVICLAIHRILLGAGLRRFLAGNRSDFIGKKSEKNRVLSALPPLSGPFVTIEMWISN
jgi:hypothetical protein